MSVTTTSWVVKVRIPAGWKAFQPVKAKIVVPESGVEVDEYQLESPVVIEDVYAESVPSVNYLVRIVVDRRTVANVSRVPASMLVAKPESPFKPKAFDPEVGVSRGRFVSFEVIPLSDAAGEVVHTLYVAVKKFA